MHCEETIRSDNLCFQEIVLEMQVLPDAALGFTEKKKKKEKYGNNITLPTFTYNHLEFLIKKIDINNNARW